MADESPKLWQDRSHFVHGIQAVSEDDDDDEEDIPKNGISIKSVMPSPSAG